MVQPGKCPENFAITGNGEVSYVEGPWQLDLAAQEFQQIADPPSSNFLFNSRDLHSLIQSLLQGADFSRLSGFNSVDTRVRRHLELIRK
jgi:hypothetical protein